MDRRSAVPVGAQVVASGRYSRILPLEAEFNCCEQRTDSSHSLRPLTIGQLCRATQAHTDAEWRVDDMEIGQARISTIQTCRGVYLQHFNR